MVGETADLLLELAEEFLERETISIQLDDAFRTKRKIRTDEDAPGAIVLYKNETELLIQILSS